MATHNPGTIIKAFKLIILQGDKRNVSEVARKLNLSSQTVNTWVHSAEEGAAKNRWGKMWTRAKDRLKETNKPKKKVNKEQQPKPSSLETENAYLRWVNEGYRLGYVDRLMAEYLNK